MNRLDLIKAHSKDAIGYEIGVLEGEFSNEIITVCPDIKALVLIDAWQHWDSDDYKNDPANVDQAGQDERYRRVRSRFCENPKVHIFRHESRDILNEYVVKEYPPDWVFLDANHSYDAVLADLQFWSRFTNKIFAHDFVFNSLSQAYGFGVIEAVNDFVAQNPQWKIKVVTEDEWPTVMLCKK